MLRCKVLIVDDSRSFLDTVAGLLEDEPGVSVVGLARSGREGLDLAEQLQPDLILTDLAMPDLDGLELTRELSKLPRPPLVAIMTVHDQPRYRREAETAGAARFFLKRDLATEVPTFLRSLHPNLDRSPAD